MSDNTNSIQPQQNTVNTEQKPSRKLIYLALILGFSTLLVFATYTFLKPVFFNTAELQDSSMNEPLEDIRIANIKEFSIFNIIAQEKGYFKENGLNANITEYDAGPSSMKSLLEGKSDIAVAGDFVGVANIFKSPNIRIISEASSHRTFNVIARVDKGIKQPKDLKGKKLGVTKKSSGEFYLNRFLTLNNLTAKDIQIEDLPPAEMMKRLESGELDAIVIFDPHAYNLNQKLGDNIVMWSAQGDQYTYALIYTTESFIQNHPEVINKYLKAISQAEQLTKENPSEVQQLLSVALKYDKKYITHMWNNFNFKVGLEQELLLTLEDQASFSINNGLTDQTKLPNYLDFIYFDGLNKAKPDSITIIH